MRGIVSKAIHKACLEGGIKNGRLVKRMWKKIPWTKRKTLRDGLKISPLATSRSIMNYEN